jgi:hypothetical protein
MTETRLKKSHVRNFVKKFSNSSYWAINLIKKIYKNKKSREGSTVSFLTVSPPSFKFLLFGSELRDLELFMKNFFMVVEKLILKYYLRLKRES